MTEKDRANAIFGAALDRGRTLLGARECAEILSLYGIPSPRTLLASNPGQAREAAALLGFPLVLKIASEDITHKSDVGGVKVGISSERDLQEAYNGMMASVREKCPTARIDGVLLQPMVKGLQEVIVGLKRDPVFGPVVLLGLGGVWVELLRDVSVRICPAERKDVLEMLRELKGYPLLAGFRGSQPVDINSLVDLTIRVSDMGMELPQLAEMDLNPVMLHEQGKGCTAVDCRIIIATAP